MKSYPSIDGRPIPGTHVFVQPKFDGNNIRAEWNNKRGFYKFGTRKQLIDRAAPIYGIAVDLILEKYAADLVTIFIKNRWQRVTCFFELYGPNSFAGMHDPADKLDVMFFDANVFKIGILGPKQFVKTFSSVEIPKILYEGKLDQEIIESIKSGTFPGATFEGVVCKAKGKYMGLPLMFKIKNRAWIERVKAYCKGDEKKMQELL